MKYKVIAWTFFFTSLVFAETPAEYIKRETSIESPFELRDPFRPPRDKVQKEVAKKSNETMKRNGIYTNLPAMNGLTLENLKIIGVVIGKNRRAMAQMQGNSSNTYILKEGMTFGPEETELKAILPGGVIFVEKITNVYGQKEYLETVIPISQE